MRFLQKIFVQTFNLETLKVAFILLFLFYREINSIFIPYRTENDNSNFLPILVSFILFVLFFLTLFDILKFKKWNLPLNYLPIGLIFLASFDFFIHEIEISEYFIFLVNCLGSFLSINLFLNLRNTSNFKINFLLFSLILVLTTKSVLNFFSGNLFFEGEKDYNYQIYSYTASLAAIILIQTLKKSYFSNNFILKVFIFFLIMSNLFLVIIYGGRGAMLIFLVFSLFNFRLILSSINELKYIIISIIFVLIYKYFSLISIIYEYMLLQSERFQYDFNDNNRTEPFKQSFLFIEENLFTGYGFFNAKQIFHSHNILLNLLMQFGLFLGLFIFGFFIYRFFVFFNYYKSSNSIIIPFIVYTIILLSFSSNYYLIPQFIFILFLPRKKIIL